MASIEEIKVHVSDLHDLAARLGLKRPQARGNYQSPHHPDKSPSLAIYDDHFHDFSSQTGGDCVELVAYARNVDTSEAMRWLHDAYGLSRSSTENKAEKQETSLAEFIAQRVLANPEPAVQWLVEARGIDEAVARAAVKTKAIGYNDWVSPKYEAGSVGHGGPAAAFVVRSLNPGQVVAVDLRYLDPALNGHVKTQSQGEKSKYPWTSSLRRLEKARSVYIVESAINALSVESAGIPGCAALAVRGTNVAGIDWRFLAGKQVYGCMDWDEVNREGKRPGPEAAWKLTELLTGENVAVQLVDQLEWDVNDANDFLQLHGATELKSALQKIEPWAIPGLPGAECLGRKRIFLPSHDWAQYWRFRVKADFTTWIKKKEDTEEGEKIHKEDVAGFRIAGISRVTVAGATATLSGELDSAAKDLYAVAAQVPNQAQLVRQTMTHKDLHNLAKWEHIGFIFERKALARLIYMLIRGSDMGGRKVANFVGLCWLDGKPRVNEGTDSYFENPEQQCPYHALTFPRAPIDSAKTVVQAYQKTFTSNAAAQLLTWALGAHLKSVLGFWPHMTLESSKGSGKSTLTKRLERSIGMTMFGRQTIGTAYRIRCCLSGTSHPVGWEELSAGKQDTIDAAVGMLQEAYQYTPVRIGSEQLEFLIAAPVLLAGEDVPVRPLLGKVVRVDLSGRQGPLMPENLPNFPVRAWLEYLAELDRETVIDRHRRAAEWLTEQSRAPKDDPGARRMIQNYAAVALAWRLLCHFAGMNEGDGGFLNCLVAEMNSHIAETDADREPWVWILEIILSEIDAKRFQHPYAWDRVRTDDYSEEPECLILRTSHCIDHIAHANHLRDRWNALSIKSNRAFRKQLLNSGTVVAEDIERVIGGRRNAHCVAISVDKMQQFGLHAGYKENHSVEDA